MTQVTQPPTAPVPAGPAQPPGASGGRDDANWRPAVRIIAVLVVVAALAIGTLTVVSTFFMRQHTESKTFTGTVSAVRVTEDVGDVKLRTVQSGGPVRASARITDSFQDASWSANLESGTLVVDGTCTQVGISLFFNCSVDLTIDVPAGVPVEVESDTGDLTVIGAFSAVDLTTSTGDVTVQQTTGPVRIRSNTGDVRASGTRSLSFDTDTDTGDVRLSFDVQPQQVSARTNTGDVRVLVPEDTTPYDIDTDTDTGDVSVDVTNVAGSPHRITARTDTGDVTVRYR